MTDKETEGYEAYHAGKGLGQANPYGIHNGRHEWNKGWLYAREEHGIAYRLGQSMKEALTEGHIT